MGEIQQGEWTVSRREQILELLWKQTGGIIPETGKAWLTPRMEREAKELEKRLDKN